MNLKIYNTCLTSFAFKFQVDWDELHKKLDRLEDDCKASWDNLRAIVKHDGSSNTQLKSK